MPPQEGGGGGGSMWVGREGGGESGWGGGLEGRGCGGGRITKKATYTDL